MGKCIDKGYIPYFEKTVCDDCVHQEVCGEKDYLLENRCSEKTIQIVRSIKTATPEFDQRVVIFWGNYADIAVYRRGMACPHWATQHYGTVDLMSVTHWMPLPQPPKEA